MYVRLRTVKNIEINGKMQTFHPGDWVEVSKSLALRWLSETPPSAEMVNNAQAAQLSGKGCGVVVLGDGESGVKQLAGKFPGVELIGAGAARVMFSRSLLWTANSPLRFELVPVGLNLIERWEMAVPLASYTTLAQNIGTDEEREETKALVHDLRIPFFDSRLIFVRRTRDTEQVINTWQADVTAGKDANLSLLRAIYRVKPLVLSLPASWIVGRDHAN